MRTGVAILVFVASRTTDLRVKLRVGDLAETVQVVGVAPLFDSPRFRPTRQMMHTVGGGVL